MQRLTIDLNNGEYNIMIYSVFTHSEFPRFSKKSIAEINEIIAESNVIDKLGRIEDIEAKLGMTIEDYFKDYFKEKEGVK
jgi:hypothetical protein